MSCYLYENHRGSPTLILLNVLGVLGVPGIAQAQSPQLLYDLIDGVDLRLVIGR